jgi:hypothetical protein
MFSRVSQPLRERKTNAKATARRGAREWQAYGFANFLELRQATGPLLAHLIADAGICVEATDGTIVLAGTEALGQVVDDAVVVQALVACLFTQAILPCHAYLPP